MSTTIIQRNGNSYHVTQEAGSEPVVRVQINRSSVNRRGFYQNDTVYRTIKPGSQNYKAALRAAAKEA